MSRLLPKDVEKEIRTIAYNLCAQYNYGTGDIDSTSFIDMLFRRPDIGGRLKEYLPDSSIRVYIKDTLCGKYTKNLTAQKLEGITPIDAVRETYGVNAVIIGKSGDVVICRDSQTGIQYLVSHSTFLRWESALKKVLEYMAKTSSIYEAPETVKICLIVVDQTAKMTYGDKMFLAKTLSFVNARALII